MRRPNIKEKVPTHLHPFIATQDSSLYTAIDHASWRYIMKVSKSFFASQAHQKYLDGLRETGISLERIPLVSEMDECLQAFGWRAVPVVGFIPPAVFMEFLSLGVLPIACDMRRLEHLSYTPAPDIVHEAAGHAPIIADQEYADYLTQYGEVSRKVIFSSQDMNVYEAIRHLSDTKEDPSSSQQVIDAAQKRLDAAVAEVDYVSEATELARMSWWTIEYGLVGDVKSPKIYGAGLLSSVSESYHCFNKEVQKIALTVDNYQDCINRSYDITKPQPQLYVTPDFQTLSKVLERFAETLAYRRGGTEALEKAKRAKTTTTAVLDSEIQISGTLVDTLIKDGKPCYLKFQGPTQLSFHDSEIEGQGPKYHAQGFGTAIGVLKGIRKSPADLSDAEIAALAGRLEFESGVIVEGKFKSVYREQGKTLVLSFENCTVKLGNEILFQPDWGTYDLACGEKVVSVFGGAADRGKYLQATGGYKQKPGSQKTNLTPENRELVGLYARVRELREARREKQVQTRELAAIHDWLEKKYKNDWLLRLELLEFEELSDDLKKTVRTRLDEIAKSSTDSSELITRGLALL